MKDKRVIAISIFSIAVVILLLRPFMVYQMAQSPALSKDPVASCSLFQRLIKKKDDHHAAEVQDYLAVLQATKKTAPILIPVTNYNHHSLRLFSLKVNDFFLQPTTFKVCQPIKQYRLFSKYRI